MTGGDDLRRRRAASWRCEPMPDGRRDPADPVFRHETAPSTYGLTQLELAREIHRQQQAGWFRWELRARFADPGQVAA